jgi:hypothetical protein
LLENKNYILCNLIKKNKNQNKMEEISTIELIKLKTEELSVDTGKFYKGNNSAGTRARKLSQELKALLQTLRTEILDNRKKEENV